MVEMNFKGGVSILASPPKVDSLLARGWKIVKPKAVKEPVKEPVQTTIEDEE